MLLLLVPYGTLFVISVRMVRAQTYNVPETLTFLFYSLGLYLLLSSILLLPISVRWPEFNQYDIAVTIPGFLAYLCWCAYGFYSKYRWRAAAVIVGGHIRMRPLILMVSLLPYALLVLVPVYCALLLVFAFADSVVWMQERLYGDKHFQRILLRGYGRNGAERFRHWGMLREGIHMVRVITRLNSWRGR